MSEQHVLNHGSTIRFSGEGVPLAGIVLERFSTCEFKGEAYAIFRCHGSSETELRLADDEGIDAFLAMRRRLGIYPRTRVPA